MTVDTVGGVWTYALDLCRGLVAAGCRVTLASFGERATGRQRAEVAELAGVRLVETPYKLEWMPNPWADVDAAGKALQEIVRTDRPELIHLNGYAHAALSWPVPVVVVAHSCVFTWWRAVHGGLPPQGEYAEYRRRVRAGLEAANAVVAPTRAMLAGLQQAYGWAGEGCVIPNGIVAGASGAQGPKGSVIASAGRWWDPAKGFDRLERIAPRLSWPLVVAGAGGYAEEATRGRVRNLQPLGKLSRQDTRSLFAGASLFAAPVRYEPFGLSILEAAEAGCALVLSDLPSLRESWDEAAEFVDQEDAEAWVAALNALAGDERRRARSAARARQRACRFSHARMAEHYLELYRSLLRQFPSSSNRVGAAV